MALGINVRTGWAACVVAGGSLREPHVSAREQVSLVEGEERFVFHRASEAPREEAEAIVAAVQREAFVRAAGVLRRLGTTHDVKTCVLVAKTGIVGDLGAILGSHPRIHAAEGLFYRDVFVEAARDAGMRVTVVSPSKLDTKNPALAAAAKVVGKPWSLDWKLAALAAWGALGK